MMVEYWTCPECGVMNQETLTRCLCGCENVFHPGNQGVRESAALPAQDVVTRRIVELIKTGDIITRRSRLTNFAVLGSGLVLFFLAGLIKADMISTIALIVTIFIHELGHLLAMWMAGYRNLQILFLPFFGGIAAGTSAKGNADNEGSISLAGPFIGLLSAVVSGILYSKTGYEFFRVYTRVAVIINVANLLPIYPLDGGRFFAAILFTRFPRVEMAFKILAAGLLGLAGIKFGDIILGLIAFVVGFSIRRDIETLQIMKKYREAFGTDRKVDEQTVGFLHRELSERNLVPARLKDRERAVAFQISKMLEKLHYVHATARGVFLLMFFYFVSFVVLPFAAIIQIRGE